MHGYAGNDEIPVSSNNVFEFQAPVEQLTVKE